MLNVQGPFPVGFTNFGEAVKKNEFFLKIFFRLFSCLGSQFIHQPGDGLPFFYGKGFALNAPDQGFGSWRGQLAVPAGVGEIENREGGFVD